MLTTYLYWKSVFILLNIYLFTLVLPELLNLLIFLVVVSLRNKTGSEWQLLVEVSRWENVSVKKIHFFHRFYDHLGIVFLTRWQSFYDIEILVSFSRIPCYYLYLHIMRMFVKMYVHMSAYLYQRRRIVLCDGMDILPFLVQSGNNIEPHPPPKYRSNKKLLRICFSLRICWCKKYNLIKCATVAYIFVVCDCVRLLLLYQRSNVHWWHYCYYHYNYISTNRHQIKNVSLSQEVALWHGK